MWDTWDTYDNYTIENKDVNYIFVIESSAAMSGVYIEEVNNFMRETIQRLREFNREDKVTVSVLLYNSKPYWMHNLRRIELDDFTWEDIDCSGLSNLGQALIELNEKGNEFKEENNGNVIVYITHNRSTDLYKEELDRLNNQKWFYEARTFALIWEDSDSCSDMYNLVMDENLGLLNGKMHTFDIPSALYYAENDTKRKYENNENNDNNDIKTDSSIDITPIDSDLQYRVTCKECEQSWRAVNYNLNIEEVRFCPICGSENITKIPIEPLYTPSYNIDVPVFVIIEASNNFVDKYKNEIIDVLNNILESFFDWGDWDSYLPKYNMAFWGDSIEEYVIEEGLCYLKLDEKKKEVEKLSIEKVCDYIDIKLNETYSSVGKRTRLPLVILVSNGLFEDTYNEAINRLKQNRFFANGTVIAIPFGEDFNEKNLSLFTGETETVIADGRIIKPFVDAVKRKDFEDISDVFDDVEFKEDYELKIPMPIRFFDMPGDEFSGERENEKDPWDEEWE